MRSLGSLVINLHFQLETSQLLTQEYPLSAKQTHGPTYIFLVRSCLE